MKELVEVIAKSLVDYPDEVVVTETENEKAIVRLLLIISIKRTVQNNYLKVNSYNMQ